MSLVALLSSSSALISSACGTSSMVKADALVASSDSDPWKLSRNVCDRRRRSLDSPRRRGGGARDACEGGNDEEAWSAEEATPLLALASSSAEGEGEHEMEDEPEDAAVDSVVACEEAAEEEPDALAEAPPLPAVSKESAEPSVTVILLVSLLGLNHKDGIFDLTKMKASTLDSAAGEDTIAAVEKIVTLTKRQN